MSEKSADHANEIASPERTLALYRIAALAREFDAEHFADEGQSLAERVAEGRFYVACVGQFKRGKSTLLNALAGRAILPAGVAPVTSVPTILRHGEKLAARVRVQGPSWTEISADSIEQYVSEKANPENAKAVVAVEVFLPSPLLATGMCLVDTPGLGSVFGGNTAATHAFLPHIDAAIVVIGADPPLSGDELQLVQALSLQVRDTLFVLNKADRTGDAERREAAAFARQVLSARLARSAIPLYEVSALERLEGRGPERDWPALVRSLENLLNRSGRVLVGEAADKGLRRIGRQLLQVLEEQRGALQRPLAESERCIRSLNHTLDDAERARQDLGHLFAAEQQRLSKTFAERCGLFLNESRSLALKEFIIRREKIRASRNGPAFRRQVMGAAQEVAQAHLVPWLCEEEGFAEEAFQNVARRFPALANDFLRRLDETGGPELAALPHDLDAELGLEAASRFYFHMIERIADPASPALFVKDIVAGVLGLRGDILRNAEAFLNQLLEVNSSRVQSDVEERVRESRAMLESEIRDLLRQTSDLAQRALARARSSREAGAAAVEEELARLAVAEQEIRHLIAPQ